MMRNPGVQRRAQAELDRVLRGGRLPEMGDRERTPYMRALVQELMRCQPVGPLGECLFVFMLANTRGFHE